jgi:hypothetical protein
MKNSLPFWKNAKTTPAPKDRAIMIIGRVCCPGWDGEPVMTGAKWSEAREAFCFPPAWEVPIRQTPADELVIDSWCELPSETSPTELMLAFVDQVLRQVPKTCLPAEVEYSVKVPGATLTVLRDIASSE